MFALVGLFWQVALRELGLALVCEFVIYFVLRKMDIAAGEALALLVPFGAVSFIAYILRNFSKNLSWLMGLPYSKRQLAGLHYLINAGILAAITISQVLVVLVLNRKSFPKFDARILQSLGSVLAELPQSPYGVASLLICFLIVHMLCLSIFVTRARPATRGETKRRAVYAAIGLGGWAICEQFELERVYNVPLIMFCIILLFGNSTPMESLIKNLVLAGREAWRFRIAGWGVGLAQCLLFIGITLHGKSAANASFISQTDSVLGPLAGQFDENALVKALEGPGCAADLRNVAAIYRRQNAHGLTVQNALANHEAAEATAVLQAFKPEEMRVGELMPLFAWVDRKLSETHSDGSASKSSDLAMNPVARAKSARLKAVLYTMIKAPMDIQQSKTLLDSPSPSAREFVLIRSRYHRSPELQELITAFTVRSSQVTSEDQVLAEQTLSVLRGGLVPTTLDRGVASSFYADPDCSWLTGLLKARDGNPQNEAKLNICLRKEALEGGSRSIRDLEALGWISLPLNDASRCVAKAVLARSGSAFK